MTSAGSLTNTTSAEYSKAVVGYWRVDWFEIFKKYRSWRDLFPSSESRPTLNDDNEDRLNGLVAAINASGLNTRDNPIVMSIEEHVPAEGYTPAVTFKHNNAPTVVDPNLPVSPNGPLSLLVQHGYISPSPFGPERRFSDFADEFTRGVLLARLLNGDKRIQWIYNLWINYSGTMASFETAARIFEGMGLPWDLGLDQKVRNVDQLLAIARVWPVLLVNLGVYHPRSIRSCQLTDSNLAWLDDPSNLESFLVNNSPTYSPGTTFAERMIMTSKASSQEVINAILGPKRKDENALMRDPDGIRQLLRLLVNSPAGYHQINRKSLSYWSKRHPAFQVRGHSTCGSITDSA